MGEIKGFLFAVRHGEILMTDLGLTLPLPSSDSSEITPSEMEQIHSLEEIPDDVREQLLAEDVEHFHEQREM